MNLVWISDSPDTPSGFGNVTRFVCEGLAQRGHRVNILGWQTREAHEWNGCYVHANGHDALGSDALFRLLLRLRPEIVIALGDVWWLPYFGAPHLRRQMEMLDTPWMLYFPIDGDMEGERLPASWNEMLRAVDIPVAMSRYGQRVVQQAGLTCHYIPHGVDLEVFCPPRDRAEAKQRVGAQGKFVVLSDSRNQPRKLLPRLLEIFAKFSSQRPDVLLHLHTDPDDEFAQSVRYSYDVRADIRRLGIEAEVRFSPGMSMKPGGGLPLSQLADYYKAADVHLLASSGEGFGLPTLQAASCGTVPMASAYTASLELVEGHGQAIAMADWAENEFGIRRGLIDIDDAVAKLVRYYDDRELLHDHSIKSRQFAEGYGWDGIITQWDQLLRSIESRGGRRTKHAPTVTSARRVEQLLPDLGRFRSGASVKVKVVEHEYGRLEASIMADVRGRTSDVAIPTLPRSAVMDGVKVVRRMGYIGMNPADALIFEALQSIFPVLSAWIPAETSEIQAGGEDDYVIQVPAQNHEDARLDLAQSVLLLNVNGQFSDAILWDAAFFGVVCVGRPSDLQLMFWPDTMVDSDEQAVMMARSLLTNAGFQKRASKVALESARNLRYVDEKDVADCWRRRSAEQHAVCPATAR